MSTNCTAPILTQPIIFLNASVISFNTSLGIGSASESTLTVDLVEDCDIGQQFWPTMSGAPGDLTPLTSGILVGAPVYFDTTIYGGGFFFGGVLTNWTKTQSQSGKTYNVSVTDPRQLLQNVAVIVDSYLGQPAQGLNYLNVYAHKEGSVLDGNCSVFGTSNSNERGMPYSNVISELSQMNPTIYSPTGYPYIIDWGSFPQGLPEYYRVAGPQTVLQLLQDVCDTLGFSFYVYLEPTIDDPPAHVIRVGLIDLKQPPPSFNVLLNEFDGIATDISYGQELRNEVTKAIIFGEQVHYLSYVNRFQFYFGEDLYGNEYVPVVPTSIDRTNNTFWIHKKIDGLNSTLSNPFPTNGPYYISEQDIRAAMASYEEWLRVAFTAVYDSPGREAKGEDGKLWPHEGTLNRAIQKLYPEGVECTVARLQQADKAANGAGGAAANIDPTFAQTFLQKPENKEPLKQIHAWLADLGNTYYGKQFLAELSERICYYQGEEFQQKVYSSVPTNDGGWVDGNVPVLGLADPELGTFRADDYRIGCFAVFVTDGNPPDPDEPPYEKPAEGTPAGDGSVSDTPL